MKRFLLAFTCIILAASLYARVIPVTFDTATSTFYTNGVVWVPGTGPALGNTNGIAAGFNVPTFTNFGVQLEFGRSTNAAGMDVAGALTNYAGSVFNKGLAPAYSLFANGSGADAKWWVNFAFGNSNVVALYSDAGGLNTSNGLAMFRNGNDPLEFQSNFRTNRLKGDVIITSLTAYGAGLTNVAFDSNGKLIGVAAPAGGSGTSVTNGFILGIGNGVSVLTNIPVANAALNINFGTNQNTLWTMLTSTNIGVSTSFPLSTDFYMEMTNSGAFALMISNSIPLNGTNVPSNSRFRVKLYKPQTGLLEYTIDRTSDVFPSLTTNLFGNANGVVVATNAEGRVYQVITISTNLALLNVGHGSIGTLTQTNSDVSPIITWTAAANTTNYIWALTNRVMNIAAGNNVRVVAYSDTIASGFAQFSSTTISNTTGGDIFVDLTNTFTQSINTNRLPSHKVMRISVGDSAGFVDAVGVVYP